MFFKGNPLEFVDAEQLAGILNGAKNRPRLVSMNFHNSGKELAVHTIARGAEAALGFLEGIEGDFTDFFFAFFYNAWRATNWQLLPAFAMAQDSLPHEARARHGVVLWSAQSLLTPPAGLMSQQQLQQQLTQTPLALPSAKGSTNPNEWCDIKVEPLSSLNYSMLHNNRNLFRDVSIIPTGQVKLPSVHLQVDLHVGETSGSYVRTLDVETSPLALNDQIRVPLTSSLIRTLQESTHTVLTVEMKYQEHTLFRDTFRVTLLPIDEWRDDDENRQWLPSFVLPRDPVVADIVAAGQRHLRSLCDDYAVGFDGYQSDPDNVDLQVQAVWWALVEEYSLDYVNPPPTYSRKSQRIRFPSRVVQEGRGTCIELALLLASCIEHIDLFPVLFLLDGHAFVGYWRSEEAHLRFRRLEHSFREQSSTTSSSSSPRSSSSSGTHRATSSASLPSSVGSARWALNRSNFHELIDLIYSRELVPLETVCLTEQGSFSEALREGIENLRHQNEFDAMLDVRMAREEDVTPLPIRKG